jgi:hypothetical protein
MVVYRSGVFWTAVIAVCFVLFLLFGADWLGR